MALTKRTYQINTNRGVDLSSSPLNVAPSRASYMRNMINDGGVNKKRHGWNEIAVFEDAGGNALAINGIWEYVHPIKRDKSLIIYAGEQFFKCRYDFSEQLSIPVEEGANVNGEKCKAYYKDGLLWIIGCGDYLVYDGTSISRVENSKYAYAPTTTINIAPRLIYETDGSVTIENGYGESYEDVNLLTRKRKNKLIGKTGLFTYASYNLDGMVDFNMPIKVMVEIIPSGLAKDENKGPVYAKYTDNGESVNDIVTLVYEVKWYQEQGQLSTYKAFCNNKEVTLYTKEIIDGTETEKSFDATIRFFNYDVGHIAFYYPIATPTAGKSNITVEYYADYERTIDLTASAVYTQANGVDLLLVANRDNAIFYSGLDSVDCEYSFGYISAEKFITFGSDREPITAIVPMADSVGVFKGKSFYRVSFTFNSDSETYEAEYVPQITESTDSNGCVNQFVNQFVNGDTLVFDGAGVYGIEYSSNQRSLKARSRNINKAFEQYSRDKLESAVALEYEGRYYLFIDGTVYIADSRFKVYESNRLDTSFEYEWWIWDNCPATVACSIDGKLYLGRENGRIAVFDDKFADRENIKVKASDGKMMCENPENSSYTLFTFDDSLGIKHGDKISLRGCYRLLGEYATFYDKIKGAVKLNAFLPGAYIGMIVYFCSSEGTNYEIIDYDAIDGCFYINASNCQDKEIIYTNIEEIPYDAYEFIGSNGQPTGQFVLVSDFGAIKLIHYDNVEAIIHRQSNVECEYHTPVMDLGSHLSLKILNQLAITVSSDTEGQIEVGYQTNNNNTFMKRNIGSAFDFNNFNFNTFAFDGAFYKTHIKRVFERNFNYILFKLASRSDSAFGVENFSCVYSSNNKLLKNDR